MIGSVLVIAATSAAFADRNLSVTSTAFRANGDIPTAYTCDGAGKSPPLSWSKPPDGTRSVAILIEDPDAPKKTFTHMLVTGIPASTTSLAEVARIPGGALAMKNDGGSATWAPPCPPTGRHHYIFHVYALDTSLAKHQMTRDQFFDAIKGHTLAHGNLVGMYGR